ncbi:hypothetical protein ACP4OV_023411 [Aristida adscensionis]
MEATAVSLARSVLDGVLSSAGSAAAGEVARLLGVPGEVEFIRNELEMMQSFLRVAAAHPEAAGAGRGDTVRTWVKQVRDLACDVEDCLLDVALYAARASSSSRAAPWLPRALAARHRIAARIRALKAAVEELNQRSLRYHVGRHLHPAAEDAAQTPVLPGGGGGDGGEPAFRESDIVGRRGEKAALTGMISGRHGPPMRVVAVWGMGGMGKSSVARMVHNDPDLLDEFDCDAWVTVPHPLDGADAVRRRLGKGLGLARGQEVREYLREKRYLVVVDDLLSLEEWELIWKVVLFDNGRGSRIIVTTRREDVARHCAGSNGRVYELKPLGDVESMDLLCQKVYKTTDYTLLEDMAEQATHILRRCRGLPLAISTIGGLLANRPKTSIEWRKLHEHLGAELESDLRNITRVIVSSYDGLPYHLKSIFLYLSIFPENHEIRCTRLLRRWMAEGYIAKNRDMPVEDVGERFYNELINRSMIQPSKKKFSPGERVSCRVHTMVLQIILSKSIEENQLLLIDKHSSQVPQNKVRHLVVSGWKRGVEKWENIRLSYIRSLTIFGECPESLLSPKMRMLRVLDLEDTENLKNDDLKHVGELYHLRYLSLRGTKISKLPSSLQKLQYLETLDIQDTLVTHLPEGIAKLEKLQYLLAGINFTNLLQKMAESGTVNNKANLFKNMAALSCCDRSECCNISSMDQFSAIAPKGIERLRNLHMLGVVNVGHGSGVAGRLKKLTHLTNLRRLGVAGLTEEDGDELCKSIGELRRLQRLEIRSESLEFLARMGESAIPRHLVSLRLCGTLTRLPEWISSLNSLAKVKLLGTQLEQGDILRLENLRNLALLSLWENSYLGESLHFSTCTFPKLKFLDIDGLEKIKMVTIEEGAMPELEQLWVNKCPSLHDNSSGLSGVPYLLHLNELVLKKCGEKKNLIDMLQGQVNTHVRRPKFLIGKSIILSTN